MPDTAKTEAADLIADFSRDLAPQDRHLRALLDRQAAHFGDRRLIVIDDTTLSFVQTRELAARSAAALAAAGINPGDRVAILCGNRLEFLTAYLGCAWLGAVAVPINVASRGAQLEHILRNSGARLIVAEASLAHVLAPLAGCGLPLAEVWLVGGDAPEGLDFPVVRTMPGGDDHAPHDGHAARPGDTVAILYTSGTTGPSKGVCCPQAQFLWWGVHTAALLGVRDSDVLLTTLPLFHVNALNTFYQALLTGSTFVAEKRFSASGFTAALKRHQATVTYLLGAMIPILLSRPPEPGDSDHPTRVALGPGVPAEFHAPFRERFGFGLVEGYGSTETNFVIGAPAGAAAPGSMGRLRPGFEGRVVDDEDNELPSDTPGELILRSNEPFAFSNGYFGMPDKTVEAWRNLWFHTGDRVVRDADGNFRFLDRLKDAIRRRGENISSFEVEQVVLSHPAVASAAVFPVQSELAEDEVMVAVVIEDGKALTPEALLDYCTPRMPYFAVPRFVEFMEALPLTENGKIQKFRLRERGITPATWDRESVGYTVAR